MDASSERVWASQFWVGVGFAGRIGLGVALALVLGRGATDGGLAWFALVTSAFWVGQVAMDLGTGAVATRRVAGEPESEPVVMASLLTRRFRVGAVLAVLTLFLLPWAPRDGGVWVLVVSALAFLVLPWQGYGVMLSVRQRLSAQQVLGLAWQSLAVLGAALLLRTSRGEVWVAVVIPVREALGACAQRVQVGGILRQWPSGWGRRVDSSALRGSGWQGLGVLFQSAYFHADVFLVRLLAGQRELGAYAAALRPLNPILALPSALMGVWLPFLARSRPECQEPVPPLGGLFLGLGLLGPVFAYGLGEDAVGWLYEGRHAECVPALKLLSWAWLGVCVGGPAMTALVARGHDRLVAGLLGVGFVANVVGNLVAIPTLGHVGAAATTGATEIGVGLAACALLRRLGGCDGLWSFQSWVWLPAVGALVFVWAWPAGTARLWVGVLVGVLAAGSVVTWGRSRRLRAPRTPF